MNYKKYKEIIVNAILSPSSRMSLKIGVLAFTFFGVELPEVGFLANVSSFVNTSDAFAGPARRSIRRTGRRTARRTARRVVRRHAYYPPYYYYGSYSSRITTYTDANPSSGSKLIISEDRVYQDSSANCESNANCNWSYNGVFSSD